MAWFQDLSPYTYFDESSKPQAFNIGWLSPEHPFPTAAPSEEFLAALWEFCRISVVQTRGIHSCEFCGHWYHHTAKRGETRLNLGSAEIRVFSESGGSQTFAAPTLIYHYVQKHRYRPPDAFIAAVLSGPRPPSNTYFDILKAREIEWCDTDEHPGIAKMFRLEKRGDDVERVDSEINLDEIGE
jgi:hypothetical protein